MIAEHEHQPPVVELVVDDAAGDGGGDARGADDGGQAPVDLAAGAGSDRTAEARPITTREAGTAAASGSPSL